MKDEKQKPSRDLFFSQSQIGMLAKCPQAFAFRYGEGMKKPPSGAMTFGNAFERGIDASLEEKIATDSFLPSKDVQEIAVAELELEAKETEFAPDDPLSKMKDVLPPLVDCYHEGEVQTMEPVAVQKEIKFDFKLQTPNGEELATWVSYVDVEERSGLLRDIKTAKRRWPARKHEQEIQPVTYTLHKPGDSQFQFDIAIRGNKKPTIDLRRVVVTEAEKRAFGSAFVALAHQALLLKREPGEARPTARFMPGAWWCSKKWCGFHEECSKRWNLPIPD